MNLLVLFLALILGYALVSRRLEGTMLTAPLCFTGAGMLVSLAVPQAHQSQLSLTMLLRLAEIGLVLLLFTDASRTDLRALGRGRALPERLLTVGMLLTILLGMVAALAVFAELSLWEAGILSAILAPTDAGLGQVIVNSPRVPAGIRRALNVEAGLNDGLAVPFLLFFLALAAPGGESHSASLMRFAGAQLGYGALLGTAVGLLGGYLLGAAHDRGLTAESWLPLAVISLPLLSLLGAHALGASAFIAAFVAGLTVQYGFREVGRNSVEFAEEWGQMLNASVFFLFGIVVARAWGDFTAAHLLYALLSLTAVRILPVAAALRRTGLSAASVLFMGWFGPRGLASIVLGLVFLEHEARLPGETTIRLAVMATVLLSIFAHGASAAPGTEAYARFVAALPPDALESNDGETPRDNGGDRESSP